MDQSILMWSVFFALIIIILIFDLGLFTKKPRELTLRESVVYSSIYISIGLLFGLWILYTMGSDSAELYWAGFLVEKSLSLDNIFVISLVLTYFSIPREYQHKVLFFGILGAIILRGIMIVLGSALVEEFHWVLYLFSAFLVFSGVKMLGADDGPEDISKNPMLLFAKKYLPIKDKIKGSKFFVKEKGKIFLTPLMLALLVVEVADVIFAVDSVPAILALTTDPYIVLTSNIFAVLGLRALYFVLEVLLHRFEYLKYALSVVLIFIGSKIFIIDIFKLEKFPAIFSLSITVSILAIGILYSLHKTRDVEKD